jgi:hypothetical protein
MKIDASQTVRIGGDGGANDWNQLRVVGAADAGGEV